MLNLTNIIILIIQFSLVYTVYINGKNFYEERTKNRNLKYKIYDIGHKYLPNLSRIENIELITNIFLFSPFILEPSMIKDYLSFMTPIFTFRLLTTNATILPKSTNCDDNYFGLVNFLNGHCYDKLFSGHMASASIISLLLNQKNYNKKLLLFYNLLISFLLISSRQHYTADILFGSYIGTTSYFLDMKLDKIMKFF